MENETRQAYIKRLWNANTADEIAAILDEYDAEKLPKKTEPNWDEAPDWANWWAVDRDERAFWYENEPSSTRYQWEGRGVFVYAGIVELKCFVWTKTLTQRP